MRVVVIGAGKLGYQIAELMSNEQYDVTFIDKDESRLHSARESLDLLTMVGSGTSQRIFADPDVKGAELLVAVTDSDDTNMVACLMGKTFGIKHTAARIRDTELLRSGREILKQKFQVDLILNPEQITAQEIRRMLMTPSALHIEDFAGGKVRLFETKIESDSRLAGVMLKDMKLPPEVLAAMIFRDHQMIIPHGNDKFLPGDSAYFIGNPQSIEELSSNFVERQAKKLNTVLIVGAGRTGRALAVMLERAGLTVKIFERDSERCQLASDRLSKTLVVNGDATNIELLNTEGAAHADVAVCLTEDDRLNLMLALLLKHMGVGRTVIRLERTEYADLTRKVGVNAAVSSRLLSAGEVLAFARHGGVISLSLLEGAKAEAVEVVIQRGSKVAGKALMSANLPKECLVCSVIHDGEARVANGRTFLRAGDRAVLIIDTRFAAEVMDYFKRDR